MSLELVKAAGYDLELVDRAKEVQWRLSMGEFLSHGHYVLIRQHRKVVAVVFEAVDGRSWYRKVKCGPKRCARQMDRELFTMIYG